MLTELRIDNFAIIDHLLLNFEAGLTVFTGETGAGKSIIIDAIETILGNRVDTTFIRSGADRASIEATFRISRNIKKPVHQVLQREELLDDPDYVTLGREIRRNGRSVARVNGRTVTVSLLQAVGEHFIDIHGQSQHLSLLRVSHHLGLLDRYADTGALLTPYQQTYRELQRVRTELAVLRQNERDAARRADLLEYQIDEIVSASLVAGEDTALLEERNRLANAEGLASLVQTALQLMDEGDPESPAITDLLGETVSTLSQLNRLDGTQESLSSQAAALFEDLTELSRSLRDYLESIEFNPKRLTQVEERLDLISGLKRKYGENIDEILSFAAAAKTELASITNAAERILELEAEQEKTLVSLAKSGLVLSDARRTAAKKLSKAIERELDDLRMAGARFQVSFERHHDPQGVLLPDGDQVAFDAVGLERVEFLIETNPGEGFKPLVKIASGGETARLMLALKNVLARADHVPTLIFDEIDQGIGGRVGTVVGRKLWKLTHNHQVLCITHLPQLAAYGAQHYQVEKHVSHQRTTTSVSAIQGEARVNELAQMLGEVSVGTLKSAQEILHAASEFTASQTP